MALRIRPTPTRFPTNILYTPVDSTLLHSIHDKASDVSQFAPLPYGRYLLGFLPGNKEGPSGTPS